MLYCREKFGKPVIKYSGDKLALNAFLIANGGNEARFDEDGKAHVLTRVSRSEPRFVYVLPGAYLRCLGECQFSAISSRQFEQQFEITNA